MKNKILIIFFTLFIGTNLIGENLQIESKKITLDKNNKTSIFKESVIVKTEDKTTIESDYAEYNKVSNLLILKKNIYATDIKNNVIETEYAEYNANTKIFESKGFTKIVTTEKYVIEGKDITLDNSKNIITSNNKTIITDQDENKIYLDNFEYQANNHIFKSIGYVQIIDNKDNSYEFSQIYIDTKKKEILGSDIKSFMNDENFQINKKNKPRIFSNSFKMNKQETVFNKSIFTLCDYRKNDKCPPWSIQASKMLHDSKKKTIYYDNAVVKVYDIPIFYFPKFSHPDPTVDRRSGFLPPSLSSSKNLGNGVSIPYFWDLGYDKNLTLTNNLYASENPLFLGEYQQAFRNSNFIADFGYTEGYKKNTAKKKAGNKSHFFTKFVKNFENKENSESSLNITLQDVSNDKYLKLHKIKSNLVDYNTNTLENSINFTHEDDDIFFGLSTSVYETLNDSYEDKYEYILPEVTFDKNLFSNNEFGNLDLQTNYKIRNYDTNKFTNFLVNDFNWEHKEINSKLGFKNKLLGNLKNINYETKNVELYKKDTTSELFGSIGYLTELNLQKNINNVKHSLKPKLLVRYSPGSMRKETDGSRLNPNSAFNLNRLNNINNYETGLSSTLGFDYKIKKNNQNFDFSVAQIINEKENKKMASKTSLDEKLSDLVGTSNFKMNNVVDFNYNFSVDQNYNDVNYNEFGTSFNFNPIKIDFDYLKETKHIGDQEYFKTKVDFFKNKDGVLSFETKRNLVTDSSEFYNLGYEYINDCLKAGLVYRREFYNDSELEPENSLMFEITLIPFGKINSPKVD
ncbi:hypothetical protein OAO89_03470 [Pelagibacteraceae bacterium]|nr:hypothetical protein [Pelagibacteraceae bacterium]